MARRVNCNCGHKQVRIAARQRVPIVCAARAGIVGCERNHGVLVKQLQLLVNIVGAEGDAA